MLSWFFTITFQFLLAVGETMLSTKDKIEAIGLVPRAGFHHTNSLVGDFAGIHTATQRCPHKWVAPTIAAPNLIAIFQMDLTKYRGPRGGLTQLGADIRVRMAACWRS